MNGARIFLFAIGSVFCGLLLWSLRFVPPEFRAWEKVRSDDNILFEPNMTIDDVEVGDLGYKSWVKQLQHPRRVAFTTDATGFRNAGNPRFPEIVVVGDSYVVGTGVSDNETFPSRIEQRLSVPVYNYGFASGAIQVFLNDPRFANRMPRVVVYAPLEHRLIPRNLDIRYPKWPPDTPTAPGAASGWWHDVGEEVENFFFRLNMDNGVATFARYQYNGLMYRVRGLDGVTTFEGATILRLPIGEQKLDVPVEQRNPAGVISTLENLKSMLSERGSELVFCPLFAMGTIYPEVYPQADRVRIQNPSFLDAVIAGAKASGVRTVDLRESFRKNRSPYLYQPDDSHWNARAIGLAADELASELKSP